MLESLTKIILSPLAGFAHLERLADGDSVIEKPPKKFSFGDRKLTSELEEGDKILLPEVPDDQKDDCDYPYGSRPMRAIISCIKIGPFSFPYSLELYPSIIATVIGSELKPWEKSGLEWDIFDHEKDELWQLWG